MDVRSRNYFDKEKLPYVHSGHNYAVDIVEGVIPSCIYVKGTCERYFSDLEKGEYPFDAAYAERYLRLVQKFKHVKGKWDNPLIVYEPWQNFAFMNIMGFFNTDTGFRRYRIAHIEIPRGNGKSVLASQAGLFFLALDDPVGNEIDCIATRREQARIVLNSAMAMAKKNPSFLKNTGTKVQAHKIIHPSSFSEMIALSSDHSGLDGRASVLSIADELHAMRRDTFEVVYSGMSKRKDSLMLCITTAGFDMETVGYDQSNYAKKVATGKLAEQDDQFFSLVYTIDEGDDIFSEETWRKANPNWDISVDPITFNAKSKRAQETPSDLPNFKVKHLNTWLSEHKAFFDVSAWDRCEDPNLKIEDFIGCPLKLGLDVSSKIDLTSLGYVFRRDGKYYIFDKSRIPEATVRDKRSTLYENCIAKGHLIQTKGEVINQTEVEDEILDTWKVHKLQEVFFDPWSATGLSQRLESQRVEMVEFRMNTANLSEPTKQLDAWIREGKIVHNGSPLLRWCLGNVVCKYDAANNVFPRKEHEKLKIDPIIAIIMAIGGWIQHEENESIYESRGMIIL